MSDPLLSVSAVRASFQRPDGALEVLGDLSLDVYAGEFLCIVGPSGGGKTTLLRLMAGLVRPHSGEIRLEGQPVLGPRRQVGLVFQSPNLMPWRTVLANVALPLELEGVAGSLARQRAGELVALVGLQGFEHEHPAHLSGGMAQRVAIARALIQEPHLLLLDEPFGALDALTREQMGNELLRIWQLQRTTVVMVTHSVQEAVFLADRVIVLSARPGCVVAEIPVYLDRPRTTQTLLEPEFAAISAQVRAAIQLRPAQCPTGEALPD